MEEKDWRRWRDRGRHVKGGFGKGTNFWDREEKSPYQSFIPSSELASEVLRVDLRYFMVPTKLASEGK